MVARKLSFRKLLLTCGGEENGDKSVNENITFDR